MPYVKQDVRDELQYPLDVINGHITDMLCSKPEDRAGILNYVITVLIDNAYGPLSGAKYRDYNEAIGMLECCKLEFYRKAAAPYEDLKEKENGKVLDGETRKKSFFSDPDKDLGIRFNITEEECINGKTDLIFLIRLNDNISIFIRANTYMNATHKLENIIMKEKLDFETRNLSHYLVVYKKWENLEPEIKNAFEAKYRDVDDELIDTNINTDEYVKFMKRPKPASVKITPTEMMMAKPTDGYDRIIDPALEQEKELFLKEMLCNNPLSPSTFFSDGGKTRKLISEHLSSIFNPELSQSITDCGKLELEQNRIHIGSNMSTSVFGSHKIIGNCSNSLEASHATKLMVSMKERIESGLGKYMEENPEIGLTGEFTVVYTVKDDKIKES